MDIAPPFAPRPICLALQYYVQLDDILNEAGDSLVKDFNISSISEVATFGQQNTIDTEAMYQLLDTATYTVDANGNQIYSMKYFPSNMLNGYSTNQIISASGSSKNPPKIDLANGAAVKKGDLVKVTGSVDLSKSELTHR